MCVHKDEAKTKLDRLIEGMERLTCDHNSLHLGGRRLPPQPPLCKANPLPSSRRCK